MPEGPPSLGREDQIARGGMVAGEAVALELSREPRHQNHVPAARMRLEASALAVAAHLKSHAELVAGEVDVGPDKPEDLR